MAKKKKVVKKAPARKPVKKVSKKAAKKAAKKVIKKSVKKVAVKKTKATSKKATSKKATSKKATSKKVAAKKATSKKATAKTVNKSKIKKSVKSQVSTPALSKPLVKPLKVDYSKAITPLADRLVIRAVEAKQKTTPAGLILTDAAAGSDGYIKGTVLAAGHGSVSKKGRLQQLDVKVGDVVLFSEYVSTKVNFNNEDLHIVHESDILGIIE